MKSIRILSLLSLLTFAGIRFSSCQTVSEKNIEAQTEINKQKVNEKLSADAFESKLSTTENSQLIDVRTPEEYAQGFIAGAINVNFYDADFSTQVEALDLDKELPVFIYCGVGGRSGKTATLLVEKGFKEIYDLQGGFTGWVNQNKPVKR
jgi:rhodanese-related sulfurtransferase